MPPGSRLRKAIQGSYTAELINSSLGNWNSEGYKVGITAIIKRRLFISAALHKKFHVLSGPISLTPWLQPGEPGLRSWTVKEI